MFEPSSQETNKLPGVKPLSQSSKTYLLMQKNGALSTLNFRLPTWTHKNGAQGVLNNESLSLPTPGV